MRKIKIILYFMVISLFYINPILGENSFENPGFETGDYTDWDKTGVATVSANSHNGSYAAYSNTGAYADGGRYSYFSQDIDLTNVDDLTFYTKHGNVPAYGYSQDIILYIDSVEKAVYGNEHDWTLRTINVSSYSGVKEIKFSFQTYFSDMHAWIDDVCIEGVSITEINFYPNVDEYNTVPIGINYTISENDMSWDNYVYVCEYATANNTYDIYNCKFIQYVDSSSGYIDISNLWPFGMWISNIKYVEVSLFSEQHAPVWTEPRPNNPQWMYDYLDYDGMILNHSYEIPDPIPTPDPTPDPTPEPTITPQPTATPQPTPDPLNESLNTSFRANYNNLVNGTINGFFEPVYNATDYFCSPLISLNDTLTNFTVEMNQSFNTSSSSLVLSASLMYIIMCAIPAKLINVMTYYLIWVVILLIFKSDD